VVSEAVEMGEVISEALEVVDVEVETALALRFVDCCVGIGYGCIGTPTGLQSLVFSSALTSMPIIIVSSCQSFAHPTSRRTYPCAAGFSQAENSCTAT